MENAQKTVSDGSTRVVGKEDSRVTITRDTASKLTDGIKGEKTSIKILDIEAKGQERVTVLVITFC